MNTDVSSVSAASLSELVMMKSELDRVIVDAQEKIKFIKSELEERYLERGQETLRQTGRDFGSVSFNDGDYKVKLNLRKRVEWDEGKLLNALNRMDEDTARHYAQVKYSITESKYNAAPPEIKSALSDARTVHLQGVSIDVEEDKDA
jgi:hypothetical protein